MRFTLMLPSCSSLYSLPDTSTALKLPLAFAAARPVTFKVVICRFAAAFTVMSPLTFGIVTVMLPSAGSTLHTSANVKFLTVPVSLSFIVTIKLS